MSSATAALDTAPVLVPTLQNLQAERGLLGAILMNNQVFEEVAEQLLPEHFAAEEHRVLFDDICRRIERGQIAQPETMGSEPYLIELVGNAVTLVNAREYARIIRDLSVKRNLMVIGQDIVHDVCAGDAIEEGDEKIERAEKNLFDLATAGYVAGGFEPMKTAVIGALEMAETAHKSEGAVSGLSTGFKDMDELLGGFHRTDLVILAGRPSMGKTSLATNIAFNAAHRYLASGGEEGAVVGFFSLEMSSEQLALRILSEQSNLESDRIRKGRLTNDEFTRMAKASQLVADVPLFIDDTPDMGIGAMRARARRMKRKHDVGLIVVDYLQLIENPDRNRNDGRVQEVSAITRGLKVMAKELDVPVLALSQLNRKVEEREDKRPHLPDLRESGSIEQDSDVVLFVYREEHYLEKTEPQQRADEDADKFATRYRLWEERRDRKAGLAEVIAAKQRHGPIGKVDMMFDGRFMRFGDLDHHPDQGSTLL